MSALPPDHFDSVPLQPDTLYTLSVPASVATGFLPIKIEDREARYAAIPTDDVQDFLVETRRALTLALPRSASLKPVATGFWAKLKALRARLVAKDAISLSEPRGLTLIPRIRGKAQARAFRKNLKILRMLDLPPERTYPENASEMVTGWPERERVKIAPSESTPRAAVLIHLYYVELWPEFAACLAKITRPFTLIVTHPPDKASIAAEIRAFDPEAQIIETPNFGRDLGPFFVLLDRGVLDQFDLVLKLHAKKSLRNGSETLLGTFWRRRFLLDLAGDDRRWTEVLERFAKDPKLGLIGPSAFRLPNERFPEKDAWGGNRSTTLDWASRVGTRPFTLDFIAGAMFWVRPSALKALRNKGLSDPKTYAAEAGRIDGALEHALERVTPYAVKEAGFTLADLPAHLD